MLIMFDFQMHEGHLKNYLIHLFQLNYAKRLNCIGNIRFSQII